MLFHTTDFNGQHFSKCYDVVIVFTKVLILFFCHRFYVQVTASVAWPPLSASLGNNTKCFCLLSSGIMFQTMKEKFGHKGKTCCHKR